MLFVMVVSHKLTLPCLGVKLKVIADASENYNSVLAENRKLFNEIQELKGDTTYFGHISYLLHCMQVQIIKFDLNLFEQEILECFVG